MNLKSFGVIIILFFLFSVNHAEAALILQAPKYIGLNSGLVGYWSFDGKDVAGTTVYDRSGNAKNGSSLGQDISAQGLVGWWKLDGASSGSIANGTTVGFEDFSGKGNNGTANNSNGTGMAWTTGKIGLGAVNFDGGDDYVNIGNSGMSSGKSAFSVSAWVYPTALANGPDYTYQKHIINIGSDGIYLLEDNTQFWGVGFYGNDSNWHQASSATGYTVNQWRHLVGTYDGTTLRLYIDGVQADTANYIGTNNAGGTDFIGSASGSGRFLQGLIDDIRIYNRAISAAEVSQLYSYGLPKFAPTAGRLGQGIDSTKSYVNPGNVSSSVNSFSFWTKTASSSPTVNLLDLNASQSIKIVAGTVTASGLTSPSIFVDGVSGTTVNAGWHHIAVTTGTAVNASAVNLGLNATTTAPLDGVLDDVRFYNRVINTDEIKRLYKIGATLKVNTQINNDSLQNGLVGYWSFDGKDIAGVTAFDRSGQGNNGTLTGGPTRVIGKIGQGLSFDGVDDYVYLGSPSSLNLSGEMSAFAWVYLDNVAGTDTTWGSDIIGQAQSDGVGGQFEVKIGGTNGILDPGNITINWGDTAIKESSSDLQTGQWYFVGFTRSGSSGNWTVKIYINGSLDASLSSITTNTGTQKATGIGRGGDLNGLYTDGLIDDVRIYNRALSADEIKRLYNLGR